MKRTLEIDSNSTSKKIKAEVCHFPFHVVAAVQEIVKYLEGDDLLHFKLACKASNDTTKGKSCLIEITRKNYDRTTSTPGRHIIKCNGQDAVDIETYLMSSLTRSYPEIKDLTFDHCGTTKTPLICQSFLNRLEYLHTARIIRCREDVVLRIYGLSFLEIYTTGGIDLKLKTPIETALIYSSEKFIDKRRANIAIRMPGDKPLSRVSGLKCNAHVTILSFGWPRYGVSDHKFESFVPNPKLL